MRINPGAVALALSLSAMPAMAVTTFQVGDSKTITYNGLIDRSGHSGLTASMNLTLDNITFNGSRYMADFSYDLSNTSGGLITGSRISIFGFNVASNGFSQGFSLGANDLNGLFPDNARGNFPGAGNINADICFKRGSQNCAGGGGTGLVLGESTSGTFTLAFNSQSLDAVAFDDFLVRYQSIYGRTEGKKSKKLQGASGIGWGTAIDNPVETPVVPEPATWAMMITGFGMMGAAIRRRRRVATVTA